MNTITRDQLQAARDLVLIDVLPAEHFQAAHLPGARNACAYNVSFLEEAAEAAPDKSAMVVVYGSSARSHDSAEAARKLTDAGYENVRAYAGGIADWAEAGLPIEGDRFAAAPPEPEPLPDGRHELDIDSSRVLWIGRNIASAHHGSIRLKSGSVEIKGGRVIGGEGVIDMATMENADIPDGDMSAMLVKHLQSDDFFDVARHPEARFELTEATPIPDAAASSPNFTLRGRLTLKGATREVEFPAVAGRNGDGRLALEAHFDIDRTEWGVIYGSGKFFEKLGKHLVHDRITVGLKLAAM